MTTLPFTLITLFTPAVSFTKVQAKTRFQKDFFLIITHEEVCGKKLKNHSVVENYDMIKLSFECAMLLKSCIPSENCVWKELSLKEALTLDFPLYMICTLWPIVHRLILTAQRKQISVYNTYLFHRNLESTMRWNLPTYHVMSVSVLFTTTPTRKYSISLLLIFLLLSADFLSSFFNFRKILGVLRV